jgi:hypothetical protein
MSKARHTALAARLPTSHAWRVQPYRQSKPSAFAAFAPAELTQLYSNLLDLARKGFHVLIESISRERSMGRLKLGLVIVGMTALLAGCGSVVGDANAGPDPGGGFYTGPNINVGQINPPGFHQGRALAQRPQ